MTDHGLADPGPTGALEDQPQVTVGGEPFHSFPGQTQPLTITVPSADWQGLLICHGDNTISRLQDESTSDPLGHLTPVQRAVLGARLRAWADLISPRPGFLQLPERYDADALTPTWARTPERP